MKRRASSEILGVMALGAALAIAMGIIMQSSAELVYGGKVTVRDTMDGYKEQISELVQVIDTFNNPASVELINYGSSPIIIDQVRINSENTSYTVYEYDALGEIHEINGANFIPVKKLVRVSAAVAADTMQILTSGANLIDIDLP